MPPTDTPAGSPSAAPTAILDHEGHPIFSEDFLHQTIEYREEWPDRCHAVDIIETNGNIWFSGSDVLNIMGFEQHKSGGHGRRLKRVAPPDIIKITDTPFRFPDGRRNRGSLISPRAVFIFADGRTQGFNPIKARAFTEWLSNEALPEKQGAETWSPAKPTLPDTEPVFHAVKLVEHQDEQGRELDPMRPVGVYPHTFHVTTIAVDEVEFCLCNDERSGIGKCWCGGKGGIRRRCPPPPIIYEGDEVIDDEDDGICPPWADIPT